MATISTLSRKLRNRVPELNDLSIVPLGPFTFSVKISGDQFPYSELESRVRKVLDKYIPAGVMFEIEEFSPTTSTLSESLSPILSIAGFACDQSIPGLTRSLVKTVPDLARIVIDQRPGVKIVVMVSRADGTAPASFLRKVESSLRVVGYAGLAFEVVPLPVSDPQFAPKQRAIAIPRRDPAIVEFTEQDDESYALRIRALMTGNSKMVPLIDKTEGCSLFLTASYKPLALGALLPLYERVFIEMPSGHDANTVEHRLGVSTEDFITFCRAQRVIPVFEENLGNYARSLVEPFLHDLSLPFLSPRTLDYIAMRYIWRTAEHLRFLRSNPILIELFENLSFPYNYNLSDSLPPEIGEVLGWQAMGAEEFEGLAFHRGRVDLANLSSGGPIAHAIAAIPDQKFSSKLAAKITKREAFDAAINLGTAQALGASLADSMISNETVLKAVLPSFQVQAVRGVHNAFKLAQLVESLELNHSSKIPAGEYLDVLEQHETKRVRQIANNLLLGESGERGNRELREQVIVLNREIAKLARNSLEVSTVEVIGDLARAGDIVSGGTTGGMAELSKILKLDALKKALSMLLDRTLDGPAGDKIDELRGVVNRVSPQAIRLYRLRKKLER